jgi:hypothetical protein
MEKRPEIDSYSDAEAVEITMMRLAQKHDLAYDAPQVERMWIGLLDIKGCILILISCLLLLLQANLAASAQQQQSPVFNETGFPESPQQKKPWTPPQTTLPELLITATAKLFEQGLADPRGCEYREVEIRTGSVWSGEAYAIKIHAWLMPTRATEKERFSVGWNGLVYRVVSVGDKANLRDDILAALKADEEMRAKWMRDSPKFPFHRFYHAVPESLSASHQFLLPLKTCLLLRLGETELAEKVWAAWMVGTDNSNSGSNSYWKDPYLMVAQDWTWALFDRVVTAHMRGDDQLALLSARALLPIQTTVEAEAERRGLKPFLLSSTTVGQKPSYLTFLEPLPFLLADQERRAAERLREPKRQRVEPGALSKYPDKAARIAILIRELDEVSARQWGQPGGVSLVEDPIVQALIAQGEDAVEPLLTVLETDKRLTRSVSFHRDFFYQRHPIGTHEAAYVALTRILKTSTFGATEANAYDLIARGMEGRRALAHLIRQYLDKYGTRPVEERWYGVLADDKASMEEWLQAAANIVYPSGGEGLPPSWTFTSAPTPSTRAQKGIRLRGETLRSKSSPTVSELFLKRMRELAARSDGHLYETLSGATNFALALLAWDGQTRIAEVRELQEMIRKMYLADDGKDTSRRPDLIGLLVSLYLKRMEVDDPVAAKEYVSWLSTVKPEDATDETLYLFEPMWRFAHLPEITRAAYQIFSQQGSIWLPIIDMNKSRSFYAAKLLETPMLNLESFREQVLTGLADRAVVGTLRPRNTGDEDRYELTVENTYTAVLAGAANTASALISVPKDDPRAARPLEVIRIRACDVYASRLSRFSGAPRFEIYWTEAARDQAIADAVKFLREHKGLFMPSSGLY